MKNKKICVTGGAGFLGSHLVEDLKEQGYENIFVPKIEDYDLTQKKDIGRMYNDSYSEIVIHLAGRVGGISDNINRPGEFFYDNLTMGVQLINIATQRDIEKFITIGSACVYPENISIPFREEDLWKGYPNENTAPYGIAKKTLLVQSQAYRKQYGFNAIFLILTNLYGEYDESSHAVPMLIKRCLNAVKENKKEIVIWGDGTATRDFLYVKNATKAIILALEKYDKPEPLNIGSEQEVSIKEVVELITKLTGYTGKIVYDTSKPSGQARRLLDTTKARKELKFENDISLEEGLKRTINYYKKVGKIL